MTDLIEMIDGTTKRLLRKVDEISIGNPADVISDKKEENYKKEIERLQKQLDIAIKALEKYAQKTEHIVAHNEYTTTVEYRSYNDGGRVAQTALAEIKELEN